MKRLGSIDLDEIKAPVNKELKEFTGHFKQSMRSTFGLVDTIARYVARLVKG